MGSIVPLFGENQQLPSIKQGVESLLDAAEDAKRAKQKRTLYSYAAESTLLAMEKACDKSEYTKAYARYVEAEDFFTTPGVVFDPERLKGLLALIHRGLAHENVAKAEKNRKNAAVAAGYAQRAMMHYETSETEGLGPQMQLKAKIEKLL